MKFVGNSGYMINAIGVLIDLVFLAIFSILLYHLLAHVRTAKIVINFTPIVKDFTKIPLMWIPHSNNVKYANVITPGNRSKVLFQINIFLFNTLNLTTLASINQNLRKCLYCISK